MINIDTMIDIGHYIEIGIEWLTEKGAGFLIR